MYIKSMYNAKAYSAASSTSPLASTTITRRDPTEYDVQIEVRFCGVCHSNLHQVRNDWSGFMPTEAYERLLKSDVKYRFSIDLASLSSE